MSELKLKQSSTIIVHNDFFYAASHCKKASLWSTGTMRSQQLSKCSCVSTADVQVFRIKKQIIEREAKLPVSVAAQALKSPNYNG